VKLPEGDEGPALVRRELTFEGPADHVPVAAASLVRAYVRGAPLVPVARIRTRRDGVDLLDGEGAVVAEVVDDEVSVLHGGRVAARFREVEVEVGDRAPDGLLEGVLARLRAAGAGAPDRTPKVIRALGHRALAPPEVEPVTLGRKATAADVVRQAIGVAVTRILRHDPGVRIGDDPEDVHQARVGARRLRSDLRTFADVLDEAWLAGMRDELRWLGGALGAVRDADVLADRLRRHAATLPELDPAGLAPVFRRVAGQREAARGELLAVLDSPRYATLLDWLVTAARTPPVGDGADRRAVEVVPRLVARPWRRLRSAVEALPKKPPDDDLHAVRILAKRARYAADAATPLVGKRAAAFAAALAGLQGVLGDHQDAVVAEGWLREALDGADPAVSPAVAALMALQRQEAAACRKAWPKAWERASAKKLRAWL
jgi:CHAD domain-containing protein